jgi:hypothetical protein
VTRSTIYGERMGKMNKREIYCRFFDTEDAARARCETRNRAARRAGNMRDIFCLVDGPEDNFAVVDLITAIELGQGYAVCN